MECRTLQCILIRNFQVLLSIFFLNILPALDDYIFSPYEFPLSWRRKTRRVWVPRYSYSYRKEATTLSNIFFTRRSTLGRKRTKKNGPLTPLTQELSANLRMLMAGSAWRLRRKTRLNGLCRGKNYCSSTFFANARPALSVKAVSRIAMLRNCGELTSIYRQHFARIPIWSRHGSLPACVCHYFAPILPSLDLAFCSCATRVGTERFERTSSYRFNHIYDPHNLYGHPIYYLRYTTF